jgi:hypothetical protein
MGLSELLRQVVARLEALGVPYFITGSMAAIYFGDPRFTNDIDIVVALPAEKIGPLCEAFPAPDFYVSQESAQRAVSRRGQFNVIHPASGLKVDLIVVADTPFNRSRFGRATPIPVEPGFSPLFSSPEDVVLMKMVFFQQGSSEKHLRDIAGILRISREAIDRDYVGRWADELGVKEVWEGIEAQTG